MKPLPIRHRLLSTVSAIVLAHAAVTHGAVQLVVARAEPEPKPPLQLMVDADTHHAIITATEYGTASSSTSLGFTYLQKLV